jgi:hypothetical protein
MVNPKSRSNKVTTKYLMSSGWALMIVVNVVQTMHSLCYGCFAAPACIVIYNLLFAGNAIALYFECVPAQKQEAFRRYLTGVLIKISPQGGARKTTESGVVEILQCWNHDIAYRMTKKATVAHHSKTKRDACPATAPSYAHPASPLPCHRRHYKQLAVKTTPLKPQMRLYQEQHRPQSL